MWAASSIAVDAAPAKLGESTLSDSIWGGCSMLSNSPFDFWSWAQGARYNTFAFRGAQMDRYGNVNNTVIGPYANPKVRLPGGGGMADLGAMIPRIYLWSTTHDPRTFVDKLDFRSGLGWGDGGDHRERLGLQGGPQLCVTNMCVFDFHPESHAMRLRSVHEGVTPDAGAGSHGLRGAAARRRGARDPGARPRSRCAILREEVDPTSMRLREFR